MSVVVACEGEVTSKGMISLARHHTGAHALNPRCLVQFLLEFTKQPVYKESSQSQDAAHASVQDLHSDDASCKCSRKRYVSAKQTGFEEQHD